MYRIDTVIGGSKIGIDGKLKLSSAVDLLQDCSQLWLKSEPKLDSYLKENGLGIFLTSRQINVLRRPYFGEKVSIITSIFENNRFLGCRNTVIYDEKNLPCILSWSAGVFVDLKSGKITRMPEAALDEVIVDKKIEMDYLPSKIQLPDIQPETLLTTPVRRSDIDQYNHVNNARYIETAIEFLPEDKNIKSIRIEYKKPAKLGESFYPKLFKAENSYYYVALNNKDNNPYVVTEFVYRNS